MASDPHFLFLIFWNSSHCLSTGKIFFLKFSVGAYCHCDCANSLFHWCKQALVFKYWNLVALNQLGFWFDFVATRTCGPQDPFSCLFCHSGDSYWGPSPFTRSLFERKLWLSCLPFFFFVNQGIFFFRPDKYCSIHVKMLLMDLVAISLCGIWQWKRSWFNHNLVVFSV